MKKDSKVAVFISFLLISFMVLIGSCISKIEPTKTQKKIDSVAVIPSTLKGDKSK